MEVIEKMKTWLFSIAIKKAITRSIPWLVAGATTLAAKGNAVGGEYGVTVNIDTAALTTGVGLALIVVQNWLKNKVGLKWL